MEDSPLHILTYPLTKKEVSHQKSGSGNLLIWSSSAQIFAFGDSNFFLNGNFYAQRIDCTWMATLHVYGLF